MKPKAVKFTQELLIPLLMASLGMLPCAWAQSDTVYSLADLGTLGGAYGFSLPSAINSRGEVTGYSYPLNDVAVHAFLYHSGLMEDLGTFGGPSSEGGGINSAGTVTGGADEAGFSSHAFVYRRGSLYDLGTLGGTRSFGTAINSRGSVTGYSSLTNESVVHAFLSRNGTMEDLGTLAGGDYSEGRGINSAEQIAGTSDTSTTVNGTTVHVEHAFIYRKGTMRDLGSLAGALGSSAAYAINSAGEVTGSSDVSGSPPLSPSTHAFIYRNGKMMDLGAPAGGTYSAGFSINSSGDVVGDPAFLYSNGSMFDLNDLIDPRDPLKPYVNLIYGRGITDNGLITAGGNDSRTGKIHAYLLSPHARHN